VSHNVRMSHSDMYVHVHLHIYLSRVIGLFVCNLFSDVLRKEPYEKASMFAEALMWYVLIIQRKPQKEPYILLGTPDVIPQTKEIGLNIISTAKISYKFSREAPYISNMFSRESPTFQTSFHLGQRSPCHSNDSSATVIGLEIQMI